MHNPFKEIPGNEAKDIEYISGALGGDIGALEALVLRHQAWIFNIAVSMTGDTEGSQDITQEALIKMITKLTTYDQRKASFRTWLYRIVANHIINLRQSEKEHVISDLARIKDFDDFMAGISDTKKSAMPGFQIMAEETKTACIQCLLLCLDRRERLVFILGAVFGVGDRIGSKICEISRANFRKILSRSRGRIEKFMVNNCSLIKKDNPCRCGEKTAPLAQIGMISESGVSAARNVPITIKDAIGGIEGSYYEFMALFRSQPFYSGADMTRWLKDLIAGRDLQKLLSGES